MAHIARTIALVLVLALASTAVADETPLPKDPEALWELAQVVLRAERDPKRLVAIATRVAKAHPKDRIWAHQLIRCAEEAARRGHVASGIAILVAVEIEQKAALEDADRKHMDALRVRWGADGWIRAEGRGEVESEGSFRFRAETLRSPLETKIRRLFEPLATLSSGDGTAIHKLSNAIRHGVNGAGPAVLPVLARIVEDTPGVAGQLAAELLASQGKADALPHLERLIRDGDALTRRAAFGAVRQLAASETNEAWALVLKTHLEDGLSTSERYRLLALARTESLWTIYRAGGTDAAVARDLLEGRREPEAFSLLLKDLAAGNVADRRGALRHLERALAGNATPALRAWLAALPKAEYATWARAMVEEGIDRGSDLEPLREACLAVHGSAEAVTDVVWRLAPMRVAGMTPSQRRARGVVGWLSRQLSDGVMPPAALLADDDWTVAFLSVVVPRMSAGRAKTLMQARPHLARRFVALASRVTPEARDWFCTWALWAGRLDDVSSDALHALLALEPIASNPLEMSAKNVVKELARRKDPRALAWFAEHVEATGHPDEGAALVRALGPWKGPAPLALLHRAASRPERLGANIRSAVMHGLVQAWDQGGRDVLVELANTPGSWGSVEAIARLGRRDADDVLKALYPKALALGEKADPSWRFALYRVAHSRLHLEAVPYLMAEYRRAPDQGIADALDALRAHQARLASFDGWAKGEGRAEVDALLAQLHDDAARVRRVAVMALAALGEKRAVPALARLATGDGDAEVRAAALAALGRMAGMK